MTALQIAAAIALDASRQGLPVAPYRAPSRPLECRCCLGARGFEHAGDCLSCGGTGIEACKCSADAVAWHWIRDAEVTDHAQLKPTCHACHSRYVELGRVLAVRP